MQFKCQLIAYPAFFVRACTSTMQFWLSPTWARIEININVTEQEAPVIDN